MKSQRLFDEDSYDSDVSREEISSNDRLGKAVSIGILVQGRCATVYTPNNVLKCIISVEMCDNTQHNVLQM